MQPLGRQVVLLALLLGCRMREDDAGSSPRATAEPPAPAVTAQATPPAPAPSPLVLAPAVAAPTPSPMPSEAPSAGWNTAAIDWLPFDVATARAKADRAPICLVVYTSWCPHCRNFSHVFEDSRIAERARSFRMVHIDADKEPAIASRFSPDGAYIPRTFFLSPDGVLYDSIRLQRPQYQYFYDERNPSSLLAAMDSALQKKDARKPN